MLGRACVFSNLATILFDTAGFVAADNVAVADCSLAQAPVADDAIVKDVGLGVEAITLADKLKADVDRPVIVTVCPEDSPWLFNVL